MPVEKGDNCKVAERERQEAFIYECQQISEGCGGVCLHRVVFRQMGGGGESQSCVGRPI